MKPFKPHWKRGKRITLYLMGGADVHADDWKQCVYFYKLLGSNHSDDPFLYFRREQNSKVLKIRLSALERVEDGWYGLAEDVRQGKQHDVEEQVKKADEINAEAEVTIRKPRLNDQDIIDVIDLVMDGMSHEDIVELAERGHSTVTGIKNAVDTCLKGKPKLASTSHTLWVKAQAVFMKTEYARPEVFKATEYARQAKHPLAIEEFDNARILKRPDDEPLVAHNVEVIESPREWEMPAPMTRELARLKERGQSLTRQRYALEGKIKNLSAEITHTSQRVKDIEKAWATVREVMANDHA